MASKLKLRKGGCESRSARKRLSHDRKMASDMARISKLTGEEAPSFVAKPQRGGIKALDSKSGRRIIAKRGASARKLVGCEDRGTVRRPRAKASSTRSTDAFHLPVGGVRSADCKKVSRLAAIASVESDASVSHSLGVEATAGFGWIDDLEPSVDLGEDCDSGEESSDDCSLSDTDFFAVDDGSDCKLPVDLQTFAAEKCASLRQNVEFKTVRTTTTAKKFAVGFVVSYNTILKIVLDAFKHTTVMLSPSSTVFDAIQSVLRRRDLITSSAAKSAGVKMSASLFVDDKEQAPTANLFHLTNGGRMADNIYVRVLAKLLPPTTSASPRCKVKPTHATAKSLPGSSGLLATDCKQQPLDDEGSVVGVEEDIGSSLSERRVRAIAKRFGTKAGKPKSPVLMDSRWEVECKPTVSVLCLHSAKRRPKRPQRVDIESPMKVKFKPERFDMSVKKSLLSTSADKVLIISHDGIIHIDKSTKGKVITPWRALRKVMTVESKRQLIIEEYIDRHSQLKSGVFLSGGPTKRYEYTSANAAKAAYSILRRQREIKECVASAERHAIADGFKQALMRRSADDYGTIYEVGDTVRLTRARVGLVVFKGMVHFAMGEHFGIVLSKGVGDTDGYREGIRFFKTKPLFGTIVPESQIVRKLRSPKGARKRADTGTGTGKRIVVRGFEDSGSAAADDPFEDSTEDDVFTSICDVLLDESTVEGLTCKRLLQEWDTYVRDSDTGLALVREVMNELKHSILRKRGPILRNRLIESRKKRTSALRAAGIGVLRVRARRGHDVHIARAKSESIDETVQIVDTLMNELVETAIEQTVLTPHIEELNELCERICAEEIVRLKRKMVSLRRRPQTYFGIRKEIKSKEYWQPATYELSLLRGCLLPTEKLSALVSCCKAIYNGFVREQNEKQMRTGKDCNEQLSGDDLLPVVIYVMVQSSALCFDCAPPLTEADLMLLEALCDPSAQMAETGYYIAVFHAALKWISDFKV